jgi:hypothetical protein
MKKISKFITAALLSVFLILSSSQIFAQPGGVPDDPSINNTNGAVGHPTGPQGSGASVDGGMNLFLLFALAYGTKRYFNAKKKLKNNTLEGVSD